jgi:hypothetical protein
MRDDFPLIIAIIGAMLILWGMLPGECAERDIPSFNPKTDTPHYRGSHYEQ